MMFALLLAGACLVPAVPQELGCDGVDDDRDGLVDEGSDADADGYARCAPDPAYADCNDLDPTVHPGARERCDGLDDDCDGVLPAHEQDLDGDGDLACAGDCDDRTYALQLWDLDGDGWTTCGGDCDDHDADAHPFPDADCALAGACERCNGRDDDCDGVVPADELDADLDGQPSCAGDCDDRDASVEDLDRDEDGQSTCEGDCDDQDAARRAGTVETCDGQDDDCDGRIDERGATGETTWHRDADGDGYGNGGDDTDACDRPDGYVADATDCDDASASVHPAALERCDDRDEDCDGVVDDGAVTGTWYEDGDGDGFGDATRSVGACAAPAGTVDDATDCDDAHADVWPGAPEVCDGRDDDCDGAADDDATDATAWYPDADGDGWGAEGGRTRTCAAPGGHVAVPGDCDDGDGARHPDATERCNDGVDADCDGEPDPAGFCGALAFPDATLEGGPPTVLDTADIDGDGVQDLLVGGPSVDGGAGAAWLLAGEAVPLLSRLGDGTEWTGRAAAEAGSSVHLADLGLGGAGLTAIVGAPGVDGAALWGGAVWLVDSLSPAGDLDTAADATLLGDEARLGFGAAVATGDLDGDGHAELLVGARCCGAGTVTGAVFAFAHDQLGVDLSSSAAWFTVADTALGSVLATGDLDGDGLDDLVAGRPGADEGGADAGAAWIVWGGETVVGSEIRGAVAGGALGSALVIADLDGDASHDLVISAPDGDAGAVYVIPSGVLAPETHWEVTDAAAYVLLGDTRADRAGAALRAGDLDADGMTDLLVGGPGNDAGGTSAGALWLTFGPLEASVDLGAADGTLTGTTGQELGLAAAVLGDADGDGRLELVAATTVGLAWFEER